VKEYSKRFTGNGYAGYASCAGAAEKAEADELHQIVEVSEFEERIEDVLTFDNDKEPILQFERQISGFFDPKSDAVLKVPSVSWLVPFLLLALQERDSYGYELARRMSDLDVGSKHPTKVYRALQQMEEEGMVVSKYDASDGRLSRRRYSISEPGEAYVEFWANSLTRYQEEVNFFLHLYNEQPSL
jgi:PadR family transcriptional regulator PadR